MNPKDDLCNWLVNNYEVSIADEVIKITRTHGKENGLEEYESDILAEEINDELKQMLLNVISTYEGDDNESR